MNGLDKAPVPSRPPMLSGTPKWMGDGHTVLFIHVRLSLAQLGLTGWINRSEIMSATVRSRGSATSGFRSGLFAVKVKSSQAAGALSRMPCKIQYSTVVAVLTFLFNVAALGYTIVVALRSVLGHLSSCAHMYFLS